MKRHKWQPIQNTEGINHQECKECKVTRSYIKGRWVFTFRSVVIKNKGCDKTII